MKLLQLPSVFILLFFCYSSHGQQQKYLTVFRGDTFNLVDSKGWIGQKIIFDWVTHPDGKKDTTITIGSYANGKQSGEWKAWYPDGKLKAVVNYVDGYVNGEVKLYYENGCIAEEGFYNRGKWNGTYKQYFSDDCGKLMCSQEFKNKEIYQYNWPMGPGSFEVSDYKSTQQFCCGCDSLSTDSSTLLFRNSKKIGEIVRYKNGWRKSIYIRPYVLSNTYWTMVNRSGDTITELRFDSIKQITIYAEKYLVKNEIKYRKKDLIEYYPDGKLKSISHYQSFPEKPHAYKLNGTLITFHKNGVKQKEINYKAFKKAKLEDLNTPPGKLFYSTYDRRHGKSIQYDDEGKIISITRFRKGYVKLVKNYEAGKLVSKKRYWTRKAYMNSIKWHRPAKF